MSGDTPSVNAVTPLNPAQQQCLQNYTGMVGLDDALYNCGGSMYPNSIMSPWLTGGVNGMMMPGMFGGMYGYGPGSEIMNMSMERYMQYQMDLQKMQTKYQVEQAHQLEGAKLSIEAPKNNVERQAGLLNDALKNQRLDNIDSLFKNLKQAVKDEFQKAGYTEISDSEITSRAYVAYANLNGTNLLDDARKYGKSSFEHGFWRGGIGCLFMPGKNGDDVVSELTGEQRTFASQVWGVLGTGLSIALTAAAVIFGGKALSKLPALRAESQAAQATNKLFANSEKVIASGREALASLEQRIIKENNLAELASESGMTLQEALEGWLGVKTNKNNPLTIMHNKLSGDITGMENTVITKKFDTLVSRFYQGSKSFGIAGSSA